MLTGGRPSRGRQWGEWPRSTSQVATVMQLGSALCTAAYTPVAPVGGREGGVPLRPGQKESPPVTPFAALRQGSSLLWSLGSSAQPAARPALVWPALGVLTWLPPSISLFSVLLHLLAFHHVLWVCVSQ